jgi:hypothetical protein
MEITSYTKFVETVRQAISSALTCKAGPDPVYTSNNFADQKYSPAMIVDIVVHEAQNRDIVLFQNSDYKDKRVESAPYSLTTNY